MSVEQSETTLTDHDHRAIAELVASGRVLSGKPPYRAWKLRSGYGIQCAAGYNCFGAGGATVVESQAVAEAIIRESGFDPLPMLDDCGP